LLDPRKVNVYNRKLMEQAEYHKVIDKIETLEPLTPPAPGSFNTK
jgi:hypothetical protein